MGAKPAIALCKGPAELELRARDSHSGEAASELGTWFAQKKNFACATDAFRLSLQKSPNSAKVNYFLGLSLYTSGNIEAAIVPLEHSASLDTSALQPRLLLATALQELHRGPEAAAIWKDVLRLDPHSLEGLRGLSEQELAVHDDQAVIELLAHEAHNEELILNLITAYGDAGRLDEAEATARAALATRPASLPLTKALATVLVHRHQFEDARTVLETYLKAHPGDQASEIEYLSVLVLTSDATAARPLGKKLLVQVPHNFDVLYLNGILERQADEFEPAAIHLQEAVAIQPNDYTARYNYGATLARLGILSDARVQLEAAIALNPSRPEAHFQLASVLRSLKNEQGAKDQLATYQSLQQQTASKAEAKLKAKRAQESFQAGQIAQAVQLYRQAIDVSPDDALLQYQLALALDQLPDENAERTSLERALKLDPTFALAANQLGYLESKNGNNAAAETNFRSAVKSAPGFAGAWINLAATLAAESQFAEAQTAVAEALRIEPKNAEALELSHQLTLARNR